MNFENTVIEIDNKKIIDNIQILKQNVYEEIENVQKFINDNFSGFSSENKTIEFLQSVIKMYSENIKNLQNNYNDLYEKYIDMYKKNNYYI